MGSLFDYLVELMKSPARMYKPDDSDAQEEYGDFIFKFTSDEEVRRRDAASCLVFEQGYHDDGIDTFNPSVVYFAGAPVQAVSHEEYTGRYPNNLIQSKWKPVLDRPEE